MIPVIDLFSGAGGMSYGFKARKEFVIVGAVDAELGKPSSNGASIGCNSTYEANIGVRPKSADIGRMSSKSLAKLFSLEPPFRGVLIACPPCTDFSRANPKNHKVDGPRNKLTQRVARYINQLKPKYFVYENAREALEGNHRHHLQAVLSELKAKRYFVSVEVLNFAAHGLPQTRERVVILASRDRPIQGIAEIWGPLAGSQKKCTVGMALAALASNAHLGGVNLDQRHPKMTSRVRERLEAIPIDGGSWLDLSANHPELLIPSMQRKIALGNEGSFSDVYGRMHLGRIAPTIKRECGHVGNGRYSHPTENRLLTISEMSFLQGFPCDYRFVGNSLSNCYRQIGDAVPPLISYQISAAILAAELDRTHTLADLCLPLSAASALLGPRKAANTAAAEPVLGRK
jgi:DNA (cytosine-5)-methyltransferase 1